MNASEKRNKVIWRFSDGRPGHDAQNKGLAAALGQLHDCESFDIKLAKSSSGRGWRLFRKFPRTTKLPDPDLIIGAGHATHLPMLFSRCTRGGKVVVLMKPSLPRRFFTLCLIPEHDNGRTADNVISTLGPLNQLSLSENLSSIHGLLLVGGKSRHFLWDEALLKKQLEQIVTQSAIHWTIADSPRTPASTKHILETLQQDNVDYLAFTENNRSRLRDQMQQAGIVWVSEDSMSMIYEALSTGAAVGILSVPKKANARLAKVAQSLSRKNLLTLYDDWLSGQALSPPVPPLSEAARCAKMVAERLGW